MSKYFEIGKDEGYHLNIKYDGHYFKSNNLLKDGVQKSLKLKAFIYF